MEFIYPYLLSLLAAIPVLLGWQLLSRYWNKKRLRILATENLIPVVFPERSRAKFITKSILQLMAFAAIILCIAAPVSGIRYKTAQRTGADILFVVDVSKSMAAKDVLPSRLDKAKIIMEEILRQLKDDRIGVILLGGEGYIQLPATIDYGAARNVIESLEAGGAPSQGTNLAGAIEKSLLAFPEESQAGKALIIFSDGENHEPGLPEAAAKAAKNNITIFSVGIGTTDGGPMPEIKENLTVDYKRDASGKMIITKLDEAPLKSVAEKTGGNYQEGNDPSFIAKNIISTIDKMDKFKNGEKKYSEADHRFQYFAFAALLLLIIELMTTERPTKGWKRLGFLEINTKKK